MPSKNGLAVLLQTFTNFPFFIFLRFFYIKLLIGLFFNSQEKLNPIKILIEILHNIILTKKSDRHIAVQTRRYDAVAEPWQIGAGTRHRVRS